MIKLLLDQIVRLEIAVGLVLLVKSLQVFYCPHIKVSKIENNTKIHYPFDAINDNNFDLTTHKKNIELLFEALANS